jgi:hypothetical protein
MKKHHLFIFSCIAFSLIGCSTKEAPYNTATYLLNKECKTSNNCTGNLNNTYRENEKSRQEHQKILSQEEKNEQLDKVQKELESKSKEKSKETK